MKLEDVYAQLEEDLTWRLDEIRFFRNQLAYMPNEEDKNRYRKALTVLLYSHFEGFCKTALSIYAHTINNEHILCSQATYCIAAASLANVFKDYDNPFKKSAIFANALPDDSQLHHFARQADLLGALDDIWKQEVSIPVDTLVDTEGNLKPALMRKLLYRLGFAHDAFAGMEGRIDLLLQRRNDFAHGARVRGLDQSKYEEIESAAHAVMDALKRMILDALKSRAFLRP